MTSETATGLTIAAIIPTFRRWPYMLDTVEQLLGQTRVPDEIIVVDQTPRQEISEQLWSRKEQLESENDEVYYLRQEEPRVYKARNRAAAFAKSKVLLYLDDDVHLSEDTVAWHERIFCQDNPDAVVGYTHNKGDRDLVEAPDADLSPEEYVFAFRPAVPHRIERICYCCAGHFAIRSEVLVEVGGWDEHILTYGDKEMALRLWYADKNIVYDPHPEVVHLCAPMGGTRLSDERSPWEPWERCVSVHYLALRYLRGRNFWRHGPWKALRYTVLLRRNFLRPWRWPKEIWGWIKGYYVAKQWAQNGRRCSYELE